MSVCDVRIALLCTCDGCVVRASRCVRMRMDMTGVFFLDRLRLTTFWCVENMCTVHPSQKFTLLPATDSTCYLFRVTAFVTQPTPVVIRVAPQAPRSWFHDSENGVKMSTVGTYYRTHTMGARVRAWEQVARESWLMRRA